MAGATMAVAESRMTLGLVTRYPDHVVKSEHDDALGFLAHVEILLQNGFEWTMVVASLSSQTRPTDWIWGALRYVAAKHGATFLISEPTRATNAALCKAGLWARGMPAANAAARLLIEDNETRGVIGCS